MCMCVWTCVCACVCVCVCVCVHVLCNYLLGCANMYKWAKFQSKKESVEVWKKCAMHAQKYQNTNTLALCRCLFSAVTLPLPLSNVGHTATFCKLQHTATHCTTLPHAATHFALAPTPTCKPSTHIVLQCVAVCCSVLQCVAVCCSVLQCVAVRFRVCVAVCCSPDSLDIDSADSHI